MSEKETYFDGPHMTSSNSQSQLNSVTDQRRTAADEPPLYSSVNSPNFFPNSSQDFTSVTSNSSSKFTSNTGFPQFNGQDESSNRLPGIAPTPQFQPPQLLVPNDENALVVQAIATSANVAASHCSDNFVFDQTVADPRSNQTSSIVMYSENGANEFPTTSQPVGTYMNIAHNADQRNAIPMLPDPAANFQPIHPKPAAPPFSSGETIRSEQVELRDDQFSRHPTSLVSLHQDFAHSRSSRHPDDILHSQGTWINQSYSASSDYTIQNQSNTPSFVPLEQHVSEQFEREENLNQFGLIETNNDEMAEVNDHMNNLTLSDHDSPVQVEQLNIESTADDSGEHVADAECDEENKENDKNQDEVVIEPPPIIPTPVQAYQTETSQPFESNNQEAPILYSQPNESNIEVPLSSLAIESTLESTSALHRNVNVPSKAESGALIESSNSETRDVNLCKAELHEPRRSDKESTVGDSSSFAPILKQPVENSAVSLQEEGTASGDVMSDNQRSSEKIMMQTVIAPERSSDPTVSVVDTVSMHSSYVSVKPHNLPVSNLPSSLPTTFPASDLRPNLSASNVLARHENKDAVVTEPSPHALHSQMIGSGKSNETPNSSERPFEPRPSSHTTHIATHNSSLVGPNSENAPPQNKPPVDVVESNFQQPTVESSNSKLQGYQSFNNTAASQPNLCQAPPTSHMHGQTTSRYHDERQYSSSTTLPNPEPNLNRSFNPHQDRRTELPRNPSRPHSSMSAHEPHHSSRESTGWRDHGDGYGRWGDERYMHEYPRWSRDPRYYDYHDHYRRYPDSYGYERRPYSQGYDYYRVPSYYDHAYDSYDRYGRRPRYQDYYGGYYPYNYGRAAYHDEDDDRRSVYSERSSRYPVNETYDASYQDISYNHGYLDESSFVDSSHHHPHTDDAYRQQPQASARLTPAKFSCAHPAARFGVGGFLVVIMPEPSADRDTSSVQIHSVETLLHKTKEAEEFNKFPGPLSKLDTHKNDVVRFIAQQVRLCSADTSLVDRESSTLIWEFLELMVRQNGAVLGTDISELLMRKHSGDFGLLASPNETQEMERDAEVINNDEFVQSEPNPDVCASVRFRELLLYGRRKDALEWAMRSNLWGHALLLASKTDARTHATVMLRFANSLPINDPLQTLYQLMSGRQPASTTLIADEGWGDWRPHLAMILSNATENVSFDTKLLLTMGDTLRTRGLVDAAHFCYLMTSMPLGYYVKKSTKLVLIGSSHARNFKEFAANKAIEKSETYEYAIALSSSARHRTKHVHIPPLQIYKFIYACRMMEVGLITKAFYYFETIAKFVNSLPAAYSLTLVRQLAAFVERLKPHDSRAQAGSLAESDLRWARTLNANIEKMQSGSILPSSTSCARTTSLSDVPSSVEDTHRSCEDDVESDNDDVSDMEESEEEEDGDVDEEIQYETDASSRQQVALYGTNNFQHLNGHPSAMNYSNAPPARMPLPTVVPPQMQQPTSPQEHHQFTSGSPQMLQPTLPPQMPPSSAALPPPGSGELQQGYFAPPNFTTSQAANKNPVNYAHPPVSVDPELSQASMPTFYNPGQLSSFQPHNQFSSTPNTSIPYSPPQLPPSSDQASPSGDLYDHLTNPSTGLNSRVRSESQTSDSRRSRKSFGRRSRTVSERSRSSAASEKKEDKPKTSKGWSLFSWFSKGDKPKVHKVHLPDDTKKDIQWDPERKRWVDANATEEELAPPEPPPMDSALSPSTKQSAPAADVPKNATLTRNKFSLKSLNSRSMYKNAFSSSTNSSAPSVMAPSVLPSNPPSTMFVPAPNNSTEQPQMMSSQGGAPPTWNQAAGAPQVPQQLVNTLPQVPYSTPASEPPAHQMMSSQGGAPPTWNQAAGAPQVPQQPVNTLLQVPYSTPASKPPAQVQAPTHAPPTFQPQASASSFPPETQQQTSAPAASQVAAPPPSIFYNPASFGGGANVLSQPTRGATRGKRGYPSVRR